MSPHALRPWLFGAAALLLLAAMGAVILAVLLPIDAWIVAQPGQGRAAQVAAHASTPEPEGIPASAIDRLERLDLRRKLFDDPPPPPPAAPPPPAPPPPPLRVQLLATAIEDGRSYALFLNEKNLVEVCRMGDTVGGAAVLEIADGRVVVEHAGQPVVLSLPQTQDASGGPAASGHPRRSGNPVAQEVQR